MFLTNKIADELKEALQFNDDAAIIDAVHLLKTVFVALLKVLNKNLQPFSDGVNRVTLLKHDVTV